MKKTLLFLLAAIMIVSLAACGKSTDCAQKLKEAFAAPFEYSVNTRGFAFDYARTPDSATMVLTSPDTLKGLKITRNASGITATYDDLVVTLPENTAQKLVSLDDLALKLPAFIDSGEYAIQSADGRNELTFSENGVVYTVVCGAGGELISASVTQNGKTYEFDFVQ